MANRRWVAGLWVVGVLSLMPARAGAGEAIPLVPIDEGDAGAAPVAPTPTPTPQIEIIPANPKAPEPDAGSPMPSAVPLVVPAPEAAHDAGSTTPQPEPDAGLPAATIIVTVIDAGAAPIESSVDGGATDAGLADGGAAPTTADGGAPAPSSPTPENPNFVKGELSQFLGATHIAVQQMRVGVGIGVSRIDNIIYALVEPRLDLHIADFGLGLAVPLNLEIFDTHLDPSAPAGSVKFIGTKNFGHLRSEDYDSARDYARVLQYLTYGKKEDHLYVDIGQYYAETLGHGEIMRRYQPNIDQGVVRIAAEVDAYNDYGGAEVMTNDVLGANILAGLVFAKPLSFFSDDRIARSFSVGVSYATDRTAPNALDIDYGFPGSGLNGCDCRPREDGEGNLITTTKPVNLVGVDAEVKVLKLDDIDIKPFVDFSHLIGGDSGFTVGVLGRFNFLGSPVTPTQAVRLVLEGRALGNRYRPEYFDTFYEVDKYIFLDSPKSNTGVPMTQQQAVMQGFGNRAGYYAEASYSVVNWVSATVALEGDSSGPAKNLILHAELPKLFIVQFFASYYKRGFTDFSTLTDFDQNSVAYAGARIEILPILYLNGTANQTFQLDTTGTHTFQTTRSIEGDVELGWQF